jgi:cytochrome b561
MTDNSSVHFKWRIHMQSFRHALPRIVVHWLAAVLIMFLLATGALVLAELPNTAQKVGNLRIHMILGGLAGLLIVVRLVLARLHPAPVVAAGEKLGHIGHVLLNAVILLMAASGMVLALQSGALDAVFFDGVLPEDFKNFTPRQVHGLLSRVAMGLIALHVLAALYHQFIVRDRLLSRMGLGAR